MALGQLGMSEVEFWEMRIKSFFLKLHFYNKKEAAAMQQAHNLVRLQTLTLLNIQLAKKDRIKDPRKLWHFPWDDAPRGRKREFDPNQINNLIKCLDNGCGE